MNIKDLKGKYFPVLDHGFISLVDVMGGDASIEQAARVSYGAGTRKVSETRGLIRYLKNHRHTTPFEMVEMKFHCCMPIFVSRQWIRHRTANVNEYSGRYSLMPMLFYTPDAERYRKQSTTNRQGSSEEKLESGIYQGLIDRQKQLREEASGFYHWLNGEDVARELSRIDLPLSMYTQWYWKIDLHNLMHFLTLRIDSHAQWEIREYARIMAGMMKVVAPLATQAWLDYDVNGIKLSAAERMALAQLLEMTQTDDGVEIESKQDTKVLLKLTDTYSKREAKELIGKITMPEKIDISLDLRKSKPAKFFEDKMKAAT